MHTRLALLLTVVHSNLIYQKSKQSKEFTNFGSPYILTKVISSEELPPQIMCFQGCNISSLRCF